MDRNNEFGNKYYWDFDNVYVYYWSCRKGLDIEPIKAWNVVAFQMSLQYLHVQRQEEETRTVEPDASDCDKYTKISSIHVDPICHQMLCTSKCFRIHLNTMDANIPILAMQRSARPTRFIGCDTKHCLSKGFIRGMKVGCWGNGRKPKGWVGVVRSIDQSIYRWGPWMMTYYYTTHTYIWQNTYIYSQPNNVCTYIYIHNITHRTYIKG